MRNLPKSVLTLEDFSKITPLSRESLRVNLSRLVKQGGLLRLRKGLYALPGREIDSMAVACELAYPAYLSLESALSYHGVLHQVPYSIELMTVGRSRTVSLGTQVVHCHHLQEALFWGYEQVDQKLIAVPEKAILDMLYLERLGLKKLEADEIEWSKIDRNVLSKMTQKTQNSYLKKRVSCPDFTAPSLPPQRI